MATLLNKVKRYLNSLASDRTYFFNSLSSKCSLMGAIKGNLICILIIDGDRRLSKSEIEFSSKILRCGGEHYTIRSMEDLTEIAKIKGWVDD